MYSNLHSSELVYEQPQKLIFCHPNRNQVLKTKLGFSLSSKLLTCRSIHELLKAVCSLFVMDMEQIVLQSKFFTLLEAFVL